MNSRKKRWARERRRVRAFKKAQRREAKLAEALGVAAAPPGFSLFAEDARANALALDSAIINGR